MYKTFSITVCEKTNYASTYNLHFDVYNTAIAQKWAKEISNSYELYETERFKSWKVTRTEEHKLVDSLNQEIEIINSFFKDKVAEKVEIGTTQSTLNHLHKIFETLRGNIEKGTTVFHSAPNTVKAAIENLNLLIHRYEDYNSSKPSVLNPNHPFASIVGTFKERPRYSLENSDYDHFTFNWKFGEVYINYCEVGKPILDVFKDNDDVVGVDNIRPLHYYAADFMIKFGPDTPQWYYEKRLNQLQSWLLDKGFDPDNKKLSIGLIPVAKINTSNSFFDNLSPDKIVERLSVYQKLQSVNIL